MTLPADPPDVPEIDVPYGHSDYPYSYPDWWEDDEEVDTCVMRTLEDMGIDPGQGRTQEQIDSDAWVATAIVMAAAIFGLAICFASLIQKGLL